MAKRKKLHTKRGISREELKRDRFLEESARLLMYVRRRKEWFVFGLIAVIALISIGNRYLSGKEKSHSEAEFQLTLAHQYLLKEDYETAVARYSTIAQQYENSRQGREAYYWLGEANFGLGKYEGAIKAYEKFLSDSPRDDILFPSAIGGMAACYEAMENYVKAASTYRKIYDELPKSSLAGWACLNSGICYEKAKNYEKAEEMYRIVTERYSNSTLAQEANQRLSFLRGELEAKRLETE